MTKKKRPRAKVRTSATTNKILDIIAESKLQRAEIKENLAFLHKTFERYSLLRIGMENRLAEVNRGKAPRREALAESNNPSLELDSEALDSPVAPVEFLVGATSAVDSGSREGTKDKLLVRPNPLANSGVEVTDNGCH